jgi:hypothetical protein
MAAAKRPRPSPKVKSDQSGQGRNTGSASANAGRGASNVRSISPEGPHNRRAELTREVERTDRFIADLVAVQVFGDDGRDEFATANRETLLAALREYRDAAQHALDGLPPVT